MTHPYLQHGATVGEGVRAAASAAIVGDVTLGKEVSVWYNATVRADVAPVVVGERSNIQDNAVIHVSEGIPTKIGRGVTVGHGAILHSCTVGDGCLIGMGSILLDGVVLGEDCLVGAGTLLSPGRIFPPRSLILGHPGKAVRTLTDEEVSSMRENALHYRHLALQLPPEPVTPDSPSRRS